MVWDAVDESRGRLDILERDEVGTGGAGTDEDADDEDDPSRLLVDGAAPRDVVCWLLVDAEVGGT